MTRRDWWHVYLGGLSMAIGVTIHPAFIGQLSLMMLSGIAIGFALARLNGTSTLGDSK